MDAIHNVAILGAGAMGAYFASRFADTPGFEPVLIAEGERLHRLSEDGIVVNGQTYHIPAVSPAMVQHPVDLILVAVKHHQLREAVQNLGNLVGDATIFLSVMNGLESEETIGSIYGMDKVLYAMSLGIDAVRVGNQIRYTKPGTHYFGEAQNLTHSPKVERVKDAFDRAGIHYEIPTDMIRSLWWKFMFNVGINQASAVLRAPYGVFHTNGDAQALMENLMQEVLDVAQAMQVNLTHQDLLNWYPVLNSLSPQGKTSMLQDVEAGRKTEVELFSGKVIELGQAHHVPTPVNQTVYQIIRVMEENHS